MVRVTERSVIELVQRLEDVLGHLNLTAQEFARRAALGILTDDEWEARDEIISLLFLTDSPIQID